MNFKEICQRQLPIDEGRRRMVYKDSEGIDTVGVGRNLTKPFADSEIDLMFANDLDEAITTARKVCPQFEWLSERRKAVLVNMAFNLGESRLRGFKEMLWAISIYNFERAADEMMDSKWYKQVGARAIRLVEEMRKG